MPILQRELSFQKENFFLEKDGTTLDFVVLGPKWGVSPAHGSSGGIVTFAFAESNFPVQFGIFDNFITDPIFQNEIIQSLRVWENVANIRFLQSSDIGGVDIRFGWENIDGAGGVLGQTTIPSFGPLDDTVIRFDFEENWFVGGDASSSQVDFSLTATHEIGHAIGIDHSEFPDTLMSELYSGNTFELTEDDILAAVEVYGANAIDKMDVQRFFKEEGTGHFYSSNSTEIDFANEASSLRQEGVAFQVISVSETDVENSIPIHRFFNKTNGGHFYTASNIEKAALDIDGRFNAEGIVFRAFEQNTLTVDPVYRFFNSQNGNHFYTALENEKEHLISQEVLQYEGIAFYAFADFMVG